MSRTKGGFTPGIEHPRFNKGKHITEKGYVRFTSGRNTGMREHRVVIEELMLTDRLREITTAFADAVIATVRNPPRLRADQEVHHMDGQRAHNCPQNLLVLDDAIHHAISKRRPAAAAVVSSSSNLRPEVKKAKTARGLVNPASNPPDWVTS